MQKHTKLLLSDPRAKTKAQSRVVFDGHGYQITELSGDAGAYWDVKFPEGTIHELPYFNLCISGRLDCINEVDGVPYMNDADHPLSAPVGDDGKPEEKVHMVRMPGLTRMFFGDGTKRLCVYPVDAFGNPNADPIKFQHFSGPASFTLPRRAIFVLSRGIAIANGAEIAAPNVLYARTLDVTISMPPESRGGMSWKA